MQSIQQGIMVYQEHSCLCVLLHEWFGQAFASTDDSLSVMVWLRGIPCLCSKIQAEHSTHYQKQQACCTSYMIYPPLQSVRQLWFCYLSIPDWHVVQLKCHVRYVASKPAALPWSKTLHVPHKSQMSHHHGGRQIAVQFLASCPWGMLCCLLSCIVSHLFVLFGYQQCAGDHQVYPCSVIWALKIWYSSALFMRNKQGRSRKATSCWVLSLKSRSCTLDVIGDKNDIYNPPAVAVQRKQWESS